MTGKRRNRSTRSLLVGFGGVALADILANSVVVLLILILITVNVKKEREKIEDEQSRDVSVLLSRKIAKSAVVNDIKSSRPALLHDYVNSPIDRIVDPRILPIVELHDGFIRDFYTGKKISREDLFRLNNPFDRFLKNLNEFQKERIRVDIYSIKLYYPVMSILKEHGIDIRHWHFLGYPENYREKVNPAEEIFADEGKEKDEEDADPNEGESGSGEREGGLKLPEGSQISKRPNGMPEARNDFSGGLETLADGEIPEALARKMGVDEETLREFLNEHREALQQLFSLLPSNPNAPPTDVDDLAEMLKFLMENPEALDIMPDPEDLFSVQPFGMLNPLSFRTPDSAPENGEPSQPNAENLDIPLNVILSALLDYLQFLQDAHDQHELADANMTELALILRQSAQDPNLHAQSKHAEIADLLANYLTLNDRRTYEGLGFNQNVAADVSGQTMSVYPFKLMDKVLFEIDRIQESYEERVYDFGNKIELEIYKYPTFANSEKVELSDKGVVLFPLDQRDPNEFGWRVAAVIDPNFRNFLIGYVYAGFSKDLRAVFPTDMNDIAVNGSAVEVVSKPGQPGRENWLTVVYLIIGAAVLLVLFRATRWQK